MKKLSKVLLSSMLALGGLLSNAAVSQVNAQEEYDLVVWEDVNKGIGIAAAVEKFEAEHGVNILVIEKAYAQQLEDLRLDGPAGSGPDVFTMPADQIGTAVVEGLVKEVNADDAVKASFTEASIQSQTVDGKLYGLPKSVETQILYYNKDLIAEEDLPDTLEGWYELSQNNTSDAYAFLALFDQLYYTMGVIGGYGGYIFNQDENGNYLPEDVGLNNAGAVEAVDYVSKFYTEKLFPDGIIGEQGINVLEALFVEGRVQAVISGPWNLEPFTSAGLNYGVKELPLLPNGEHMQSVAGVKSYNISSYTKNPELAEAFLLFITNEENSLVRYEETLEVPAVLALSEHPTVVENDAAEAIALQSEHAKLVPGIVQMNEVWNSMDPALQIVMNGQATAQEALDIAVQQIISTNQALQ
ncbi:extracellular solute-binding protein [Aerococcaceae bacterium DSM 109653]|uniref:Extracellular solute-binding protein n=1 Tax=Fundicoccus ignavus TaxID=2664442 RepID=A0A844BG51_9LACT|nr:extracellular solute-binding protein [Fundicoccus ignavus]MRI80920.1 extracellular solute-binding protein [Fundicoccus ignavus]